MALLPPERGGRKQFSERLGVDAPCRGSYILKDSSGPPKGAFRVIKNGRVDGAMVVNRGGQSKRFSTPLDSKVVGMIDTEGEFD